MEEAESRLHYLALVSSGINSILCGFSGVAGIDQCCNDGVVIASLARISGTYGLNYCPDCIRWFGRSLFNFLEGTGFAEDMDDALDRISTWSGGTESPGGEVAHLDRKFVAVPEHHKDHTRDADTLDEILTALLRQNPAEAMYARVGGQIRTYRLHPYTLAHWRQGLYLFALDVDAGIIKTFAVDRFKAFKRQRGEVFSYPEAYDPDALVADCFGIIGGPVQEVHLRFNRSTEPYVRERIWHRSQVATPMASGELELKMRVGLSPELENWLMGFGPGVQVLEPAGLASRIRRLHSDAATA